MQIYRKYPFLPEAKKIVEDIDLSTLIHDNIYHEVREKGEFRLKSSLSSSDSDRDTPINERDVKDSILSFFYSRLILSASDNTNLIRYVAHAEAEAACNFLDSDSNQNLLEVCNGLNLDVTLHKDTFSMSFIDYITSASNLRAKKWKLSNRGIKDGRVIGISKKTVIRLLMEVIRLDLYDLPTPTKEISDLFKDTLSSLQSKADERKASMSMDFGQFNLEEKAPPCFQQHMAALQSGFNVSQHGRFFLTTFLSSLGQDHEKIMDIFATAPDFRESVTRYQVEHITGTSSETKYSAPSCKTLKNTGICPGGNALCDQISHPLSYYFVRGEKEKSNEIRWERILTSTLRIANKSMNNMDELLESLSKLPLDSTSKPPSRSLSDINNFVDEVSRVRVKVSNFNGVSFSIDEEDKKTYLRYSHVQLTDNKGNNIKSIAITDWSKGVLLEKAKREVTNLFVDLIPLPTDLCSKIFKTNEPRCHILDVKTE